MVRLLALAAVGLAATGCAGGPDATADDGKLRVVTTVAPPPSAAEVLSEADLVLVNGLKLEEPTKHLAESNMKDGARLVEIGTRVLPKRDYIYDFSFPKKDGKPNPHLWTDPTYAIKYAAVVRDALVKADPAGAADFAKNYAAFEQQATALSDALRADQALQPQNFEDPTAPEVAALIDQIKAADVPVIFGSEVFPSKVLEEVGRSTGARYEDTLRDDDLPGEPGDAEHSWAGLMRYDYVTMITGLGGQAPRLEALDTAAAVPDDADYPQ